MVFRMDVQDVVYVKTDSSFSASNNPTIADEIERINRKFLDTDKNYVLIGPGRWGSSDPWLGIPVKWPHISAARVIVEEGLEHYRVDPSQGTHFFQNRMFRIFPVHKKCSSSNETEFYLKSYFLDQTSVR